MRTLTVDIETFSSVNLQDCGVFPYTEAPDFSVLLFGYAFDTDSVRVVDIAQGEELPPEVLYALTDPEVIKTAYNAQFERTCLARRLGSPMPPEQWRCTMALCALLGLPGKLSDVADAIRLTEDKQKMTAAGKVLIRYFSSPCTATASNGNRTRNLPRHDPDKWALFKLYNGRDVEVERAIRDTLAFYTVPDVEQQTWELDQRINAIGVRIDRELVSAAMKMDTSYQARLGEEARQITGLDNPNSLPQLKDWLLTHGLQVDTLGKENVLQLLENNSDPIIRRVLELRRAMGKTSTAKYDAMARGVCRDGRIRGLLQYYGANRTGRWAGRKVQVQNLPKNHLPDLDLARQLVCAGRADDIELLYDSLPEVLSQLIRTAFIPDPGHRFIVADFSAIEARIIAWLAGEKWVLDEFQGAGKIYEKAASLMFKVPVERIVKGSPEYELRTKGKVATLACIAEGELVLTDSGLVPIEQITCKYKLWDGEQWVSHDGIVFKGYKEVLKHDGLTATQDHLVWIEGSPEPVQLGIAAASGARLTKTGNGGTAIRTCGSNRPGETLERNLESLLCSHPMHNVRDGQLDRSKCTTEGPLQRLSKLFKTQANTALAGSSPDVSKTKVRKSQRRALCAIRRAGDTLQLLLHNRSRSLDTGQRPGCTKEVRNGSYQQQWILRAREYPLCPIEGEQGKPAHNRAFGMGSTILALYGNPSKTDVSGRAISGTDYRERTKGGNGKAEMLAHNSCKVRVYDIRNAGPHNRFTVSGCLVHNCGYGGGPPALIKMGALSAGIKEEELPGLVEAWRKANPHIVAYWAAMQKAVLKTVETGTPQELPHGIRLEVQHKILFIRLPSGRQLAYLNPRIEDNRFGTGQALTYAGVNQETKAWGRLETYGAKTVENIVQATARDCLRDAMLTLDSIGYKIVMHVHDEVILETPNGPRSVEEVCEIMGRPLPWAPGLPLKAEGSEMNYYQKA